MAKVTVWRVGLTKMLFTKPERRKRGTPEPFFEVRAFIFSKTKPTVREEMLYRQGLVAVINNTENLFHSIVTAKREDAIDEDRSEFSDLESETIETEYPKTPRVEMEIDGYEVEEVDLEEVSQYYKGDKMIFDEIYRYVAFYSPEGDIDFSYDENDIIGIEATT